jgi:small subunit ribosomal protein S4
LERRLDNVLYRMGIVNSRRQGRQAISHGHVLVNGKKVSVPSFQVRVGEIVTVAASDKMKEKFKLTYDTTKDMDKIEWLDVDIENFKATVKKLPARSDIKMPIQEQLIVELYSK